MDIGVEEELDAASDPEPESDDTLRETLAKPPELRPILGVLFAIGVAYYLAFIRLVRGDLLNSYSFVSADGFDWLVEGFAVARWVDGVAIPELPVARSPGFVTVTFLDYLIGANGHVIFIVIAFAVIAALAVVLLLARWERIPWYQAGVVVLVLAVSPVGFSRKWILSDQMATALMVLAAVALYPYATKGSRRWLVVATTAATLGGLTQLYGLAGFLGAGVWVFAVSVWRRKLDYWLGGALIIAPVVSVALSKLWLAQVPHARVPNQLVLVRLNFSMFDFYSDAWSFAFAALLPLLVVLAVFRWREVLASPIISGYWLAVLGLMVSTFFYHFEDFRFTVPTSLMMGVAIMATLPGERPLPWARTLMASTAVLAVFVGFFVAPADYVHPEWSTVEIDPSKSFVARLIDAEPKDRFRLDIHCESDRVCEGIPFRVLIPDHDRASFRIYRYLLAADSSTPVELFTDGLFEGLFKQRDTNDCCEADASLSYGLTGDRPVAGDWDGLPAVFPPDAKAGTDTPGVFRAGTWLLRNSSSEGPADLEFEFGEAGDVPVVGDWDGDGVDTVGIFRGGRWALRNSNSAGPADLEFEFGQGGDKPIVGDWDGDGLDTIGVYREGQWLLRNSNTAGPSDLRFDFGQAADRPVAGDWNGDGIDTVGVFVQGLWKLLSSNESVPPDLRFSFGAFADLPLTGDWNNVGADRIGIAR